MKNATAPENKPARLFRASYGKWQSWNDAEMNHAEWDDRDQIFAAEDDIDATWTAYTDPLLLNGYELLMIEELLPVPIGSIAADEF